MMVDGVAHLLCMFERPMLGSGHGQPHPRTIPNGATLNISNSSSNSSNNIQDEWDRTARQRGWIEW